MFYWPTRSKILRNLRNFLIPVIAIPVAALGFAAITPSGAVEKKRAPIEIKTQTGNPQAGVPGSSLEGLEIVYENIVRYVTAEAARAQAEYEAELARLQAQEVELLRQGQVLTQVRSAAEWDGTGTPCAIPQYICERESGGDPTVYNHQGSGASGKYQAMPGTWGGYGGYNNAADAPEEVQDQWATELWNNGNGCSHWSAC
mgnify:CR=1 FL=1